MDDRALVAAIVAHIEQNLTEDVGIDALAEYSGYSVSRLRQKFFGVTGETPGAYVRKRRLTEAAKELLRGAKPIEVALRYGYSSQENFTTAFRVWFGVTPAEIGRIDAKYRRFIQRLREAYSIMELTGLTQPPLESTLMGSIAGASDYFEHDYSHAMLFGLTGHAFVTNIHEELCPSSPYVWNKEPFWRLARNAGIALVDEINRTRETAAVDVTRMETTVRSALDSGQLCIVDFLEHQLVGGYDEHGLTILRPWGMDNSVEIKRITFGTWNECMSDEGWVHLSIIEEVSPEHGLRDAVRNALEFALELARSPGKYELPVEQKYHVGSNAIPAWIAAIESGQAGKQPGMHGNWWTSRVWWESRRFAARFFEELATTDELGSLSAECARLTSIYDRSAAEFQAVGEKDVPDEVRIEHLRAAAAAEAEAADAIEAFLGVMAR